MGEPEEEVYSEDSDGDRGETDFGELQGLSYVGEAVRDVMLDKHGKHQGTCWNVTHGTVVGELLQTPPGVFFQEEQITDDNGQSHSDFFPEKMCELMSNAEELVDFTSLGVPDGRFLEAFQKAITNLHESGRSVTVRLLTGNVPCMPTDNELLVQQLTKDLPTDSGVKLWVGSWRKGLSWNHAKIIAVDGKHLLEGGHNVWDPHYLQHNPVRDVSIEMEGQVAQDGHVFADNMWKYIIKKSEQKKDEGPIPRLKKSKVGLARWPPRLEEYPPMYERPEQVPMADGIDQGQLPMISIGRLGNLHHDEGAANPSDSAIVAMLASAQKSIKLCLQDLGPIAAPVPGAGSMALPGCPWPEDYMREMGKAIYERGVDVEIVVSNPHSIPANCTMTEAQYGNGWTCSEVGSEIIRSIQNNVEDVSEEKLTGLVGLNLRIAFMRTTCGSSDWEEATKAGNHAKFFIVDDICYYLGSQNLYIANLAEWGVVVDSEAQTGEVLEHYWNKIWGAAWDNVPEEERDFKCDDVFAGLELDRNPRTEEDLSPEELEAVLLAKKANHIGGDASTLTVWVKRAANVKDADGLGQGGSDAYVKLRILDSDGNGIGPPQQTRVLWDTNSDPHWNEVFDFEGLPTPGAYTLRLTLLDKDSLLGLGGDFADWAASEDKLGKAEVDLGTLENSAEYQDMELCVNDGWFADTTLSIGLHTRGGWGN